MTSVQDCTLSSCSVKDSLTARNFTATFCNEPIRDNTAVTPIVTGVSGALAVVCVVLRIADRLPHLARLQWADLCVVLALILATPMAALEFVMSSDGFGKDIWTIPFDKITRIVKFTWYTEIFYMFVVGFTKAAILLLYYRVFQSERFRKIVIASLILTSAFIISFSFGVIFHCTPISFGWEGWTGEVEGHCINFNAFAWAHAIVNIVFDIFIIVLPIPQLIKLDLGRRKLIHIILMFSVGFFITIVSIVRLTALVQFATTSNPTYDNVPTAYWSVLEAFVSIICCCLPAIRALLRRVFPSCFGSSAIESSTDSERTDSDRTYRVSKSPMPSTGSQSHKSFTNRVTVESRQGDNDDIELMRSDSGKNQRNGEC
ncbi:hypothetical protein B0A52_02138 [Exophiala mesophila]|uniref:Rhodopsin domain-containing protein n=1 Tax=Exophiala mesophila TaxID=212818 RepID=A0A438NEY9_EXOME|nr:hypothetical protein B0A52_02138 [Exophiala mesophila]